MEQPEQEHVGWNKEESVGKSEGRKKVWTVSQEGFGGTALK